MSFKSTHVKIPQHWYTFSNIDRFSKVFRGLKEKKSLGVRQKCVEK